MQTEAEIETLLLEHIGEIVEYWPLDWPDSSTPCKGRVRMSKFWSKERGHHTAPIVTDLEDFESYWLDGIRRVRS